MFLGVKGKSQKPEGRGKKSKSKKLKVKKLKVKKLKVKIPTLTSQRPRR
jgi:hypothetical protein